MRYDQNADRVLKNMVIHLQRLAVLLLLLLVPINGAYAQFASSTTSASPSSPKKTDHAERSLAAIDLAIIAGESGILDVSLEAMKRAVAKGPPVSSVDLGGLLSSGPSRRSVSSRNIDAAAQQAATAQMRVAKQLRRLHEVWSDSELDPQLAYAAWKELVLPSGRPNEAFAYSVEGPLSQSYSYSDVPFDFDQPKLTDCGAAALVDWARKSNQQRDLRDELARREVLPGAVGTVLLLNVILAQDESNPSSDALALCESLNSKTKLLVDDPNAKLLMSHVWKMLQRLDADSLARQTIIEKTLQAARGNQYWPANDWLQFLVAKQLRDSIEGGDLQQFKAAVDLSISRYDRIRANNADYIASKEATMFGEAAKRAFEAGQVPLGIHCLRSQSNIATSNRYGSQSGNVLDPNSAIARHLLKMNVEQRADLLNDLAWNMPTLGLQQCANMKVTERIPDTFAAKLLKDKRQPWQQVTTADASSISLLEWAMRDSLASGNEDDILERIAKLEAEGSDDAKLGKLVLAIAKGEPIDFAAFSSETSDGGTGQLTQMLGDGSRVLPLDLEVTRLALMSEAYREAAEQHLDRMLEVVKDGHQETEVTWLRKLKFEHEVAAGNKPTTHHDLQHWVVSNDVSYTDYTGGRVSSTVWMQREGDGWGHEFGTNVSYMMLRYPLQGDVTISFRHHDGLYAEGGSMLSGLTVEFLEYLKRLRFWGVGNRNLTDANTEAMKDVDFTKYRITRKDDALTVVIGDDEFQQKLNVISDAFPFFAMCSYGYRATTFDSLKIEGDVSIPGSVELLSPSLLGWSTKFKAQRLPHIAFMPGAKIPKPEDPKKIEHDWQFADGVIESVDHSLEEADADEKEKKKLARREALVQYLRPLCDSEEISLEFFHQGGKFSLAPALGRIAILLADESEVGLHWITADSAGNWTGVSQDNRIVDDQAVQLKPVKLNENAWNKVTIRLDGDIVTLQLNGEDVYRRRWEAEAGRNFGLFHDPTKYHVRARHIRLRGDWPEKLPENMFQTQPRSDRDSTVAQR